MPDHFDLSAYTYSPPVASRPEDVFLTRREAAVYLRRSVASLERWASTGEGPPFRKIGGRILYPLAKLRRFAHGEDDRKHTG